MIKLYGAVMSRTPRSMWALNELGLKYEHIDYSPMGPEIKDPKFLAVNPNARVPALVDGDTRLHESMAINLYLARKYGGGLWPKTVEEEGQVFQWSFWVMTEIEPHLVTIMMHKLFLPEEQRKQSAIADAEAALDRPMRVLDAYLSDRNHLVGSSFTIADLNVASVMATGCPAQFNFGKYPNAMKWLKACLSRTGNRIEGSPFQMAA